MDLAKNIIGITGYLFVAGLMGKLLQMMDSMNTQIGKETPDAYLIIDRLNDLENENKNIKNDIDNLKLNNKSLSDIIDVLKGKCDNDDNDDYDDNDDNDVKSCDNYETF